MKKKWLISIVLVVLLLVGAAYFLYESFTVRVAQPPTDLDFVSLQPGYQIETFADDLGPQAVSIPGPNNGVRMLEHKDGIFYATVPGKGQVIALHDKDGDWEVEKRTTFLSGLTR
ncbi:MAG TPA: hypothetical protein VJA18_04650, partial [Candidatus Nanoarchaeia archaeon]|nr:hypothetical protein [Candidatus Nanoarchaeia archaeon]